MTDNTNSVGLLQNHFSSFNTPPTYSFSQIGMRHTPIFTCQVNICSLFASAEAKSKKKVKQKADTMLPEKMNNMMKETTA